MGTPKATLPWAGTTLLESALQHARRAGAEQIVVVLGPATRHLADTLGDDVVLTFNPDPETGRSASIRIGSEAMPVGLDAVLVQSVDQPCSADVLNALFEATAQDAEVIAVPTYHGRRGHPVCLAGGLLPELRHVSEEEEGLRAIVRRHAEHVVEVPVESQSVVWNLNDPDAYAAARAAAESGKP
jgi:molybdenum cofactor cytidylyltransferase